MDRYTKAVLTVIAVALCVIAVQLGTETARAAVATNGTIGQVSRLKELERNGMFGGQLAQVVYCVK